MVRIIAFVALMGLAAAAQDGGWSPKSSGSKKSGEKPGC